jgi:hypothetical protein
VSRNAGGYLVRTDTGAGTATSTIFNTHATGGSAGSGGTTINSPYDTFGGSSGITLQVDYYQANPQPGPAGTSFGFYVKAAQSTTPTTGYAAIFRLTDSGADFRVWDSDSNPSIAGVGTQLGSTQFYNVGFAAATYYTLKLQVIDVGSTIQFTGSIWNQGGALIKAFTTVTDTTSAVLGAGQVGFRFGNDGGSESRIDNLTIIPEPNTAALLGGLGTMLLLRRRRG